MGMSLLISGGGGAKFRATYFGISKGLGLAYDISYQKTSRVIQGKDMTQIRPLPLGLSVSRFC